MSPDGVQKMFEGIAVTRNTRTHAGSLQALRKAVTDAQEMIDELVAADPTLFVTDVNLSFSRDVLALYDTIEIDLLRHEQQFAPSERARQQEERAAGTTPSHQALKKRCAL
ncbi:hypothetical protein HYH02_015433 [Chlamydomonas schloesseri]|uniref:Uncharacterized protein n=1 Tax=Chlamydomonas schloesseri TaxID=2026947 RepID=A0A835SFJ9_9CHLO|nr:hypothetical protein HYH02_015433 [Chlamydomonas schloesseri]|eukprot:KAG2422493.1 hypothetical protein HYH02_015433 [Chlamydomonas schloesseri]